MLVVNTRTNVGRWVIGSRPGPTARFRLFCFPYAGGGATLFRRWTAEASCEIEVCPVQLPGREERLIDRPFNQLTALVETLEDVLAEYLDVPFAFFGHSMGALIAFELTRQLRRHGRPGPVHLFVSAHRAPHRPSRHRPLHQLATDEFWREIWAMGGTAKSAFQNAELKQVFEPLLRADFALCETYRYEPEAPLDCPISAFGGRRDPWVTVLDLVDWRSHTRAPFALRMVPEGHFFLDRARTSLLQAIADDLSVSSEQGQSTPASSTRQMWI
jgi:myxalamid-type polyketide synthase MxaE and MxaD